MWRCSTIRRGSTSSEIDHFAFNLTSHNLILSAEPQPNDDAPFRPRPKRRVHQNRVKPERVKGSHETRRAAALHRPEGLIKISWIRGAILRGVEDVTFTQKLAVESHVEPLAVVIVNDDSEGVLLLGGRISVCVLLLSY